MKNELNEIVQNFTEIAERKDFTEMCKNNKLLKKDTKKLMFILEQLFKNIGVTEYSSVDRGYSGDELLEKYKYNIQKSWKGKKEKESSIKKISKSEINDGANVYLEKRLTLTKEREDNRIEMGFKPRTLEVEKENSNIHIYKYNENQDEESSSSDLSDDELTDLILLGNHTKKKYI